MPAGRCVNNPPEQWYPKLDMLAHCFKSVSVEKDNSALYVHKELSRQIIMYVVIVMN